VEMVCFDPPLQHVRDVWQRTRTGFGQRTTHKPMLKIVNEDAWVPADVHAHLELVVPSEHLA
jgi:hypothetical protein